MTINCSGQTPFSLSYTARIPLGEDDEINEVVGKTSGMGLDRINSLLIPIGKYVWLTT
jgi:hypothetical protein